FSAAELADVTLESTLWGNAADPDGDGISNLAEYALGGTSPINAASRPRLAASLFTEAGQTWLRGEYPLRAGITGVTVAAQVSADFVHWDDIMPIQITPQADGTALVVLQTSQPIAVAAPAYRFFRLRVTEP